MSLREKLSIMFGGFLSLFARKSTVEKELNRFKNNEERYLTELRKAYPSTVKILIDGRNEFMAKRLREVSAESATSIAVVGDGHISGMRSLLSEFADVEVLRLDELRTSAPAQNDRFEISYYINSGEENL